MQLVHWDFINMSSDSRNDINCRTFVFEGGERNSPQWARAFSFTKFLGHTEQRTTFGRASLDERSVRCRDLYLTTCNTHNRETSMPPVGFELTVSAGEQPQTYVLARAADGTGLEPYNAPNQWQTCDLKLHLRIQVFCDVMLCSWVSVSWCFEGSVFVWNFKQCLGPSVLEVECSVFLWNVMKHYPSSAVSCFKRPGLSVTDALKVLHSLSSIHLFLLFSLSLSLSEYFWLGNRSSVKTSLYRCQ
jgi:hypothetical protein